ncbi:hypothetical protein C8R46DRAFT_1290409 [Mycena filopes]|nr:hypothetical protein C8R46DRAFT_1290409 [Mycena filopes]
MPPPPELIAWLDEHYPSPRVDPEWLDACYAWVTAEHTVQPRRDTCPPSSSTSSPSSSIGNPAVALSLSSLPPVTEVGSSALVLDQVRVTRAERLAAGAGMGDDENEADLEVDGEGPVPNYPRGMLRFELSDGVSTLSAIEYRPLPELTLGVTPLGYKMILKDLFIRHGSPLKRCRKSDFARGLRQRLGRPEPPEAQLHPRKAAQGIAAQVAPPSPPPPPPPPQQVRSPLRDISPPPSPTLPVDSHHHSDDEDQPSSAPRPRPARLHRLFLFHPRHLRLLFLQRERSSSDEENGPSKRRMIEEPDSDDFGDDMVVDDGFLEALAKLEAEAITPAAEPGPSTSRRIKVDPDAEVITIDDDDEMEDKENVPAPQRHVRRRVFGERTVNEDVIDISSD